MIEGLQKEMFSLHQSLLDMQALKDEIVLHAKVEAEQERQRHVDSVSKLIDEMESTKKKFIEHSRPLQDRLLSLEEENRSLMARKNQHLALIEGLKVFKRDLSTLFTSILISDTLSISFSKVGLV